jgi:hypothetical protein
VRGKTHLVQRYILERFEDNDLAVLEREDGELFQIPRSWLPTEARESYVLTLDVEPSSDVAWLTFSLDRNATQALREKISLLRARLPKGPEGDLEL